MPLVWHILDAALQRLAALSEEVLLPDAAKILANPATPLVVVCDTDKIALTLFAISFLALGYLGLQPAEGKYVSVARLFTVLYFAFCLLMPVYSKVEAVHDRDFLAQFHSGAYGRRTDHSSSGTPTRSSLGIFRTQRLRSYGAAHS